MNAKGTTPTKSSTQREPTRKSDRYKRRRKQNKSTEDKEAAQSFLDSRRADNSQRQLLCDTTQRQKKELKTHEQNKKTNYGLSIHTKQTPKSPKTKPEQYANEHRSKARKPKTEHITGNRSRPDAKPSSGRERSRNTRKDTGHKRTMTHGQ